MDSGEYSLRWNKFDDNLVSNVCAFYERRIFTDVTLACDGKHFKAHKLVLAACSPYFEKLFKDHPTEHPIIYLNDVTIDYMENVMEFMYKGTTHLAAFKVKPFLDLADSLKLKGLSGCPVAQEHLPSERSKQENEHEASGGPSRTLLHAPAAYTAEHFLSPELEDELNVPESSGTIDPATETDQTEDLSSLGSAAINLKRRQRRNAFDCVEALMGMDNNSSSDDGFLPGSPSASLNQARHRILKPIKHMRNPQSISSERQPDSDFERAMELVGSPPTMLAAFGAYDRARACYEFGEPSSSRSDSSASARPVFSGDTQVTPNDAQRMGPTHMDIPPVAPGEKWFQGRLQFMLSQRGKPLLVHDGHSFGIQYIRKDKKYWQCNLSRKYNCKARVTTTDTGDIIVTNNEHCHTEIRQHLRKDYKTMKLAASLAASRASFPVSLALPSQSNSGIECSSTTSITNFSLSTNESHPNATTTSSVDTDQEMKSLNLARIDQAQRLNP